MNQIKQIHAHSLRQGTLSLQLLIQKLLNLHPPNLSYSHSLLINYPSTSSSFPFNKLLQSYSRHGPFSQALSLFTQIPSPNLHSFTFLFSACASFLRPLAGQSLHSHLIKLGFPFDPFVATSIIDMYSKTGLLQHAHNLFDEIPHRDIASWNSLIGGYTINGDMSTARDLFEAMPARNVVSWTTMVSGYAQNGQYMEAVEVFLKMWREEGEVMPNAVTVASVLPACANVGALGLGMSVEEYARREGLIENVFVGNALVEMYGKCGSIERATTVFEEMGRSGRRNLCTWNSMIMGLAVHGRAGEALELFDEMRVC